MNHIHKAALLAAAALAFAAPAAAQDNAASGAMTTTATAGNTAAGSTTTTTADPMAATGTTGTTGTAGMSDANTMATDMNVSDPMMTNVMEDPMMADFNTTNEQYTQVRQEEGFDWGWLGLLGLLGLLGMKKKDDDRDVHVDALRNT